MIPSTNTPAVSYSCTALRGTGKEGIIKCDADGYYPVILGALNTFNSAGMYYPLAPARAIFDSSSAFQRRIAAGALNGECGHPRRQPGESDRDFCNRLLDIYEPNVSHHIRKVWLVDGHKDEAGRPIVLIMGEVRPAGPRGPALKDALENRNADVCFSIRSFTHDIPVGGIWHKQLRQIVTWDWVNEPGISAAHKWRAPSLESMPIDNSLVITREQAISMAQDRTSGLGMESGYNPVQQLIDAMGWNKPTQSSRPRADKW